MTELFLESLEQRIAPAAFVDAKTVEYQDLDGDIVQVKFSKAVFTETNWSTVFTFADGPGDSQILTSLDLTSVLFTKYSLTITATTPKGGSGDGLVDVGAILATGIDFGKVSVDGRLQKIEAGDSATPLKGLDGLKAVELGGLDSGIFGSDQTSKIKGTLTSVEIQGNVYGSITALQATATAGDGSGIGKMKIGGSLVAGTGTSAGIIDSIGNISSVAIGLNINGTGAEAAGEASIHAGGKIGTVTVGGSVFSGAFDNTGKIRSETEISSVVIKGDLVGNAGNFTEPSGSTEVVSGQISAKTSLGSIQVRGNAIGGEGDGSGSIHSPGKINSVNIGGDLRGNDGVKSGSVSADGTQISSVRVGGSVLGAAGEQSGSIFASNGKIGSVGIGGDLTGYQGSTSGEGVKTGMVFGKTGLQTVTIGGDVKGGTAADTGSIQAGTSSSGADIGTVQITGDVEGGSALRSGSIWSYGSLSSLNIKGSLIGGTGESSGVIYGKANIYQSTVQQDVLGSVGKFSGSIRAENGLLGIISVRGDLTGNSGESSGLISAKTNIDSVAVSGNVQGGTGLNAGRIEAQNGSILAANVRGDLVGNTANNTGTVRAGGEITSIYVGGNIEGGAGTNSGSISAGSNIAFASIGARLNGDLIGGAGTDSGSIRAINGSISSLSLTGGIAGGTGLRSGSINALNGSLGTITVGESVAGNSGQHSGTIIGEDSVGNVRIGGNLTGGTAAETGYVQCEDGTIQSVTVGGSVIGSDFNMTGVISALTGINHVSIGGDLVGGDNSGGDTADTGAILAGGVTAGTTAANITPARVIFGGIKSIDIKGNIIAGEKVEETNDLINSGAIRATGQIGRLTVGGSLSGNADNQVLITAFANSDLAFPQFYTNNTTIGTITVKGNVSQTLIAAGVIDINNDDPLFGGFPFANIGSVTVGGNWTASSITAGADPGPDGYGSGDTMMDSIYTLPGMLGRITSIVIKGIVAGGATGDQYGFVAAGFGSVSVSGQARTIPAPGQTTNLTVDGSVKIHTV